MANPTHRISILSNGGLAIPRGRRAWLKSWTEFGKTLPVTGTQSNFSAITLYANGTGLPYGGQTTWARLYEKEKKMIQRVNAAPYGTPRWHYLLRPNEETGAIYIGEGPDDDSLSPMRWPCIALGSKTEVPPGPTDFTKFPRNQVSVLGTGSNGMILVEGIRPDMNYDELDWDTHPWLWHRIYCYQQNTMHPELSSITDSPQGIMYMPLLDVRFYEHSLGETGLWLDPTWLAGWID